MVGLKVFRLWAWGVQCAGFASNEGFSTLGMGVQCVGLLVIKVFRYVGRGVCYM